MKNKRGFVKFESLTILFVIILLFAIGLYIILGMANKQKYDTMYKSAKSFVDVSTRSDEAFLMYRSYYLAQAFDDGLLKSFKSPFSSGDCDLYESRVDYDEGSYYVTLKCGDYLMKKLKSTDEKYTVYKVSEWKDAKTNDNDDKRVVYGCDNCKVDGYYEEPVFVFLYNKNNDTSYNYLDEIKAITKVNNKTQYRTMEKAYEK